MDFDIPDVFRRALKLIEQKEGRLSVMYAEVLDLLGESVNMRDLF